MASSPNSWLEIARLSPLNPTAPAGSLSCPPPLPDPPDPLQFPPLSASKPPLKLSSSNLLPPAPVSTTISPPSLPCPAPIPSPSLSPFTTAQLLASISLPFIPDCSPNPRSNFTTVTTTVTDLASVREVSLLGAIPFAHTTVTPPLTTAAPLLNSPVPIVNQSSPPEPKSLPNKPETWASKARANTNRTLTRLSPQTLSPSGVPRVVIPDEVYQRGADLHKEFLVCRFFGRTPAYNLIQNVLNYLWGKGRHLEIHMVPTTKSVLVRVPNEFIRQKVLLKKFWYVDTSMFHVSQWSASTASPSLQHIQLWAHLKGVPFDLIYSEGLSHIAGQIGEPKETDDWTLSFTSISTAHVKVEVNTSVPLPKIVEVGRMDGSFVEVEVEYPWTPPICAHCKELGHISRNCLLLPEPPKTVPTAKNNPKIPTARTKPIPPTPSKIFCYSCKASGNLMKNCPKGPQDWIEVTGKKKQPTKSQENPSSAPAVSPVATVSPVAEDSGLTEGSVSEFVDVVELPIASSVTLDSGDPSSAPPSPLPTASSSPLPPGAMDVGLPSPQNPSPSHSHLASFPCIATLLILSFLTWPCSSLPSLFS
ncbi:hypothetical protein Rs2_05989 [Raphanus sativus]|nr:hypothetical protein Rs2_05989 [Raphanus sativus]